MDYFFGEHLRWNLGWDTPNQAGAFLATLLPLAWGLVAWAWCRSRRSGNARERWLLGLLALVIFAGESVGFYALARTYSRGALVGLIGAAVVWCVLLWWRSTSGASRRGDTLVGDGSPRSAAHGANHGDTPVAAPWSRRLAGGVPWLLRAGVAAACLSLTGFHERLAPEHLAEDRSSLNRLVLWQGGAELVAASPVRGWGWGASGAAFMHWTQPLDRREGYLSMVNSYLTVAVEAGLPVFALLLALLLLPAALAVSTFQLRRPDEPTVTYLCLAALAAWAAWLGCLFFSNLWIIRPLWIAPGIAALVALYCCGRDFRFWRRGALGALATASAVSVALWVAGLILAERQPLALKREADGSVSLRNVLRNADPEAAPGEIWVVPDSAVFGESYGQELRRWCLAAGGPTSLRVYREAADLAAASPAQPRGLLLTGQSVPQYLSLQTHAIKAQVWLLHPIGTPPLPEKASLLGPESKLLLPGIDITGEAAAWWEWAAQASPALPAQLSPGLALDVRPRWPALGVALTRKPRLEPMR